MRIIGGNFKGKKITLPIDKNTSLFLIKVEVFPLRDVWDPKILDSINSMSESVLNYKGLVEIKDLLNTMKL